MFKNFRNSIVLATLIGTGMFSSVLTSGVKAANEVESTNGTVNIAQLNNNTPEALEEAAQVGKVLGIMAVGAGTAGIIWRTRKGNISLPKNLSAQENALSIDRANPQLRKKLLRLVHNDYQTANRLLAGARLSHPDRSVDWLADKVIYDLERDRGR